MLLDSFASELFTYSNICKGHLEKHIMSLQLLYNYLYNFLQ